MTKLFKIVKIIKESIIRKRSSKNFQQPSSFVFPSDVKCELLPKRNKHRRNSLNKIQGSIWCLGSSLGRSFLLEIHPTLTIARRFSSRHIPTNFISKTGSKNTTEVDRLTIIPAWMKKPKVKKFQDHMNNVKSKSQNISQNKNLHDFHVPGTKFKMTNFIEKKAKSIHSMTDPLKTNKFYKKVINKIALPHLETKHLVLKKKNIKKESKDSQNCLEDSIKDVINSNIPKNYKLILTSFDQTGHNMNKPVETIKSLENVRDKKEPTGNNENKVEKSEVVLTKIKANQPNIKYDDRSRIRRHKAKNEIVKIDENSLKIKAKRFEKREVDMFIKKLAAKYGKVVVQKSAKPIRIYENNRPRIKYDINTQTNLINTGKTGPKSKHAPTSKVETRIPHYSKKKLNEFINKLTENSRILKKENSLLVNKKIISHKIEETSKEGRILRKEDLTEAKKSQSGVQLLNKKSNSGIKLNSKNGFLKDRDKHVVTTEKETKTKPETENSTNVTDDGKGNESTNEFGIKSRKHCQKKIKNINNNLIPYAPKSIGNSLTESSTNVRDDGKGKESTNEFGIKSRNYCQNKIKNVNNHLIPYTPKSIGNSLILAKHESTKLLKEVTPSIDRACESSKNIKQFTESKKKDDKLQIFSNNGSNNKTKLMIPEILNIEMVEEIKNEQKKSQSIETKEENSTEQPKKYNDKGEHKALNTDTSDKTTKQMKYMKYTPDSESYICAPKQKIVSCKYKMSRGVHSDKPDISRESEKHLINAQPDFKVNNDTRLNHRSQSSKLTTKEGIVTSVNNSLPCKVEFIKKTDKNVPTNIYKFHCHSESLDYKVYKYDHSPSVSLETKESNIIQSNINEIQKENVEKINTSKQRGYQSYEHGKRPIDVRNRKLMNINTIRTRVLPTLNLKKNELTTNKEIPQLTAKQTENLPKGENLCMALNRVHVTEDHAYDKVNRSKPNSEVSELIKKKNATHLKDIKAERCHKGSENIDINKKSQFLSDSKSHREKSNCADNKNEQIVNLEKQISNENEAKYGVRERTNSIDDNEVKLPIATREIYKLKGSNMDYSRRELKKILPIIKNEPNKTINIFSKGDKNIELIGNKKQQTNKEMSSDTCNVDVSNNNHLIPKKYDLKASDREILKFEVQKDKPSGDMQVGGSQIESNSLSIQQLGERRRQDGIVGKRIMLNGNIKKKGKSTLLDDKKEKGMNVFYYEDIWYKQKKKIDLGEQYPTMITGNEEHKMVLDKKSTSWMEKFHELAINKDIFNKKVKKNVFLMHGFNKVSFLKVYEDNHHLTSPQNIFPKLIPKTSINKNANKEEFDENKINGLKILENDLKAILYQQMKLYNRGIKLKYSETNKNNEIKNIYDLFDCSFIIQNFNKVSFNCELRKHHVQENLCPLNKSSNNIDLINGTTENKCSKIVPMEAKFKQDDSAMMEKIKTCGRLIIKENPEEVSLIEVLDCRIPLKCTKSTVKESCTDDKGSKMFSLTNSKHMCFYSKYRRNCMGQSVFNHLEANPKVGEKGKRTVTKNSTNQDSMASNKVNYLESMPKETFQGIPINMKMLTFKELYDYNNRKNDKKHQSLQLDDKNNIETKINLEKESFLNVKQEDKNSKPSTPVTSEPKICHSFLVVEDPNRAKIDPEILHYMKKLDTSSSNSDFTVITNEPNTKGAFFQTEEIKKNKNASNNNKLKERNTGNLFIKEICYSTNIKFLEENTADIYDVINECQRETFEYLTKLVKKHRMETKNLQSSASSNIPGKLVKSDKVFKSKNHIDMEAVTKSFSRIPILDLSTLKKKTVGNCKELAMTTKNVMTDSIKKNKENEFKLGMNSNINEVTPADLLDNNWNKLEVMKTIKEQEKQLFHIKKNINSLPQIKNEEFIITGDSKQIKSGYDNLKPNSVLKSEFLTIQNELKSSVNTESINKKKPLNVDHVQKNKAESDLKIKHTTAIHNVKAEENSFKSTCLKIKNNTHRERTMKHVDIDDTRTSRNLRKPVCNVQTVSNNEYASVTQKGIDKETQSNLSLKRDEAKIFKNNFQTITRNSDKMAENDMISKATSEQNQVRKMDINEVRKAITSGYESNNHIINKNKDNDIKTNINNIIDISNSESHVSDSIPTGLRCIRQLKVKADQDKGMDSCHLKKTFCATESIKLNDRDRKSTKSPLRKDIGKSVTLTAECDTSSKLNKYLLKHKNQLEAITKDKRVKSIKNKLSNNLRPRDEGKIIRRESHTLMSLMNAEIGKKINEDNKRDSKKGKEDGLYSQISSINKIVSIDDSKPHTRSGRNKVNRTGTFYNSNSFFDIKNNPIKITTEAKKPYFNNICLENNFRHINEYKDKGFSKGENTELNFTQLVTNDAMGIKKTNNSIELRPPIHCLENKLKNNQENKYQENIYILKPQPKVEGFISQSLRSTNSSKIPSSKIFTAKKRPAIHLMKNRIKSELKQSATSLKKKKSKHRILNLDRKLKNDQKKNQSCIKLAHSNKIFSQKDFPIYIFQKEPTKLCKNYFLETPSRQVCGLTPPKTTTREKPVQPKTKLISKLVACTQQRDDVQKQNLKIEKNVSNNSNGNDMPIISKIHMTSVKEFKPTLTEMLQIEKENTGTPNLIEYKMEKPEAGLLKNEERKDQSANLIGRTDLKSDLERITDQGKPISELSNSLETIAKDSNKNDSSDSQLITDSKNNTGLPSIVGNVVYNVKTRIQNFLLADIAKSTLNRGIIFKKKGQHEIEDLKDEMRKSQNHTSQENYESLKPNQNTKQILCTTLATYANRTIDDVPSNEKVDKMKMNSENKNGDDRKTISDLLKFKSVRNKHTCPQMSYSEVLNKFYAGCET